MLSDVIHFNIAGAVVHYDMLTTKLPVLAVRNKNIAFTVYDGPNLCQWNGGRVNRDITLTEDMISRYNQFGIAVSITFTNPTIDLSDSTGNHILEMLDRSGRAHSVRNKIVLINDDLRRYIRDRYDFCLIYSITGHPSSVTITPAYLERYQALEEMYDYIVPKFEVVFEPEFYSNITPSKYELLINDTCLYGCPYYYEHFQKIALQNTMSRNPWAELGHDHCFKIEECWLPKFNPDVGSDVDRRRYGERLGMDYTDTMMQQALNIGYRAFKISGRENPTSLILTEIHKYIRHINGNAPS